MMARKKHATETAAAAETVEPQEQAPAQEEAKINAEQMLAAVIHHYAAGEVKATKAYLADIGARLELKVEDMGNHYELRTRLTPPVQADGAA